MFNNLIESSSHAKEFKRRGSFLLFTTATYVVLFAITGVISIYAYDAHLESQSTELELVFVPLPPLEEAPPATPDTIRPTSNSANQPTQSIRTDRIDSATNPNNPPPTIGTVASTVPPWQKHSIIGDVNVDPPGPPPGTIRGVPGGTGKSIEMDTPPPPPPPAPTPTPVVPKVLKISTVLNSRAISLPRPTYPAMARQIRLQGTVTVQVLIDETGRVLSAKGTGHPLLVPEAEKAARQARFSPTVISETPVKVSGVITYNFVMQ